MKMTYKRHQRYQNARNASWQLLLDLGISELPIPIIPILQALEIRVHKYCDSMNYIKNHGLTGVASVSDGFTVLNHGEVHVFFDDTILRYRIRFTLAHELGHIICGHLTPATPITMRNKEPSGDDPPEEVQANTFASRLLAPACVLHELKAYSADEIADICQLSTKCSKVRARRMAELVQRDRFYTDPLERQVYKQFEQFIQKMRL